MPERSCMQAPSEDFESMVEESVEALECGEVALGEVGQNGVTSLAHTEAHVAAPTLQDAGGPVGPINVEGSVGFEDLGSTEVVADSISPCSETELHPNAPLAARMSGGYRAESTQLVRSSQIPSINLMVDLNEAECRRRRRRQLSNLVLISEGVDRDRTQVEDSVSTSLVSPQSNSRVIREVRATMAIGGELGINFRPDDDLILCLMIENESKEYSQMLEREAEG
ncbi:hypothetical protein RHGRI_029978 [Rhododendron griersonianum]|uniref:Uncharacterized protein n=3 Tax=Rhododendron griersonianum TaxID=479676 RepID=A0AAV6ILT2_9ERIC|nr:hypothetical protein RHGRI_029978 [Rhododendron griersonianum]